jgi:D-alanyl-D-alanine dipeptidase
MWALRLRGKSMKTAGRWKNTAKGAGIEMTEGFVYLDAVLPGVFWDAKYATADNFTGSVVDGYHVNRIVGTRETAEAILRAIDLAAKQGGALLLWDGYRPQRAVDCFLRWADAPEDGKTKARHYPNIGKRDIIPLGYVAAKSGHSRGSAIDLTLCDPRSGHPLDMGGDFDLMDVRSHHGALELPPAAARNRQILREIMEKSGFVAYEMEWWHYSLKNEPYPDRYFDFPVE